MNIINHEKKQKNHVSFFFCLENYRLKIFKKNLSYKIKVSLKLQDYNFD